MSYGIYMNTARVRLSRGDFDGARHACDLAIDEANRILDRALAMSNEIAFERRQAPREKGLNAILADKPADIPGVE
ncbi:MAG TPA: hypothetical protein VFG22_01985 [Polyangiales bacterium]|nr:hypothetical protein [Polyangiales bacterium]